MGFGVLDVGAMFLFVWLVMLLWNALVPELFSGPVLSYWQTAGVFLLSKILLSGFGGSGGKKHSDSKSKWRTKYQSKYHRGSGCCGEDESKSDVDQDVQPA